ncbi:hypothetical protein BD289DRAFT_449235 [Coniella lustricola]|uniref:MIF4G domain-containing protein n=1 Tax=Coniella lustricola TaxID=2025994 RepID=A0A2T3AN55_9PEZI|nr:hypothetical protein BD289DRAFT_449235 [Coniella lustricola]
MNGTRQSVSPAVPTIANGTSSLNGDAASHSRNGSVTIAAPGNNGYNPKSAGSNIQFGYDKTPQPAQAQPISIAGRIPSPAQSPSPIPQPSASGGKPGATDNSFKIGSFTNDGDRMAMRPPSSMQMSIHNRRDSSVSQHSDMGHHGGPGSNRGGFGQGGRGRGYNPQFNNSQMGGQPGYPPVSNNQYPRGPHNQGRGGMAAPNYGRGGMPYPTNSPQPARGSPAISHAMPGQGTPNMNAAIPVPSPHAPYAHQYGPPMGAAGYQQVKTPFPTDSIFPLSQSKSYKKKVARSSSENRRLRQQNSSFHNHSAQDFPGKPGRLSKRQGSAADHHGRTNRGHGMFFQQRMPPTSTHVSHVPVLDLTPGPEGYDRVQDLLTQSTQTYGYPAPFDPNRPSFIPVPPYNAPMYPPGSPAPGAYAHPYGTPYPPPAGQPMSRNNSQISADRPASSTGNQGPMGFSAPPQAQKGPVIASSTSSNQFVRPKSKAIAIRNQAGEPIDLKALKAPASPAPSTQQSKTPPVIASTPTPPPKTSTPAHTRTESTSNAKPEDIKAAFLNAVKKSRDEDIVPTEDKVVAEEEDKAAADESKAEETLAPTEPETVEAKAVEVPETKPEPTPEAVKTETQAETKTEVDVQPETKAEEPQDKTIKPGDPQQSWESEDDYMDRVVREMEEEDARREAAQAEITAKKAVEKEAAKKKAEEERAAASAENDRKLREQEREMERLEEEKEKARERGDAPADSSTSVAELLAGKISDLTGSQKKDGTDSAADKLSKLNINSSRDVISPGPSSAKSTGKDRRPAALNLAPLKTGSVEAPPPSAAMQALKSARFLTIKDEIKYPSGIASPNPATNAAAAKKGGSFKYDSAFLLQFQKVFTEQPSVEFSQQVKALIGDSDGSRSASTRGSGAGQVRQGSKSTGGGAFGAFTQPSGKPLPPGTTSDQRFAMSQGQMPRPAMAGPMASFGRGGAFPGPSNMTARQSSSLGLSASRTGSRNQNNRGGSKPGKSFGNDAKANQNMPLTQGMELKPIVTSSTGWKPMSLARQAQAGAAATGLLDPETVQRKVKAALNKMTPENFDKISDQILQISAQSKDEQDGRTLRQVIQLTFEKATDEAHWAAMYAKFCKRMLETMSPEVKDVTITDKNGNVVSGGALFRKYLLNRCQEDFERGWNTDMPEPKEGESKEAALLSDEYYKAAAVKRRGLGLVQFIGELFKLGMLTERIMHECVRKLLDFKEEPDEAEIESLTKLLRTIGANLDSTEKGTAMMNAYFERITNLVETTELPSRLNFMLLDIIDLRKANWESKDGPKGPKTLEEIRADAEAAAAAKAAEASRSSARNQTGGRGSQYGRGGDARNSYGNFHPPASNTVGMDDLRRLKGQSSRTASGVTLGPTAMFNSRSSSGRRLGPGGALTRGAEDSAASSRTGTPPTQASVNAFAALANMPGESENPASPPSTAASPALNHAKPDASAQ